MIRSSIVFLGLVSLLLAACSSESEQLQGTDETSASSETDNGATNNLEVDVELFLDGAVTSSENVDCTLSNGQTSSCIEVEVVGYPTDYEVGPFCPATIDSTSEQAGIWIDGENVYDANGTFIQDLAEIYNDSNWLLYDPEGNVNITETVEEFEGAARPDVDPELQNHCVEGRLEWLPGGEPIPLTITLPLEPQLSGSSTSVVQPGVTLNGVAIDPAAPVDAILGAYTIAAFDDCGGHFNPATGYHLHGAADCSVVDVEGHEALFAYAADGFRIYSSAEDYEPELDECNGHFDDALGYHYHAGALENNEVLPCVSGLVETSSIDNRRPQG